jgi:hypothetical protein
LDHAERRARAGECVAVAGGADEWIDVTRQILLLREDRRGKYE